MQHLRRTRRKSREGLALSETVRLTWSSRLLLSSQMIERRHAVLVALLSMAVVGTGCTNNPVGRISDLGAATPQPSEGVVASPSLDCVSRTCLRVPQARPLPPGGEALPINIGLCTAECSSDDDCDRVPESPCITGFTCGVAVTVGPFCCRKFCICKDYIVVPDSGELAAPKACDPSDDTNACCNIDGRQNNAAYPLCGN